MKQEKIKKAFSILKAINHPVRFKILQYLKGGPQRPQWFTQKLKQTQPAVAYHINQLEKIGVIRKEAGKSEAPGTTVFVHLQEATMQRIEDAVDTLA